MSLLGPGPSTSEHSSRLGPSRPPTIFEVLRLYPAYRRVWLARVASLLGDWFNTLALFSMLRGLNAATPEIIGTFFILKLVPLFLLSPAAGVLADRFNRSTILIVSDLVRFGVVLCYFFVPFFPEQAASITLTLVFVQACASAFFEPAKIALIPNLVPKEALLAANALGSVSWSICYAISTALGGLLTFHFGWELVLGLDALSYLISAWLVYSIHYQQVSTYVPGKGWRAWSGFGDLAEGFRYLKGHPRTCYILFIKTGLALAGATEAVLTLLGQGIYHWGGRPDLGVGILLAARAVGTGLGPIVGRRLAGTSLDGMRRVMLGSFFFSGTCYVLLGWAGSSSSAMILAFGGAIGSSIVWVFSTVLLQHLVGDLFRGRVFSAELGLAMAVMTVSIFGFTQVAGAQGVHLTLLPVGLGALFFLSGCTLVLVGRHPQLRGRFKGECLGDGPC